MTPEDALVKARHAAVVAYINDTQAGIDTMYYPPREPGAVMLESLSKSGYTITEAGTFWDDPELDATDYAHPAWWRGDDHGYEKAKEKFQGIISAQQKALEKLIEVGCWSTSYEIDDWNDIDECYFCAATSNASIDVRDRRHNPNCAYVIAKDIVDNPFIKSGGN